MADDERVLRRIRALMAKADSTTFPAEARACRDKAMELMARHGVAPAEVADQPAPPLRPRVWQRPTRVVFVFTGVSATTNPTGGGFTYNSPRVTVTPPL